MEDDVHHAGAINDSNLRFNGRTVCQAAMSAKADLQPDQEDGRSDCFEVAADFGLVRRLLSD